MTLPQRLMEAHPTIAVPLLHDAATHCLFTHPLSDDARWLWVWRCCTGQLLQSSLRPAAGARSKQEEGARELMKGRVSETETEAEMKASASSPAGTGSCETDKQAADVRAQCRLCCLQLMRGLLQHQTREQVTMGVYWLVVGWL